MQSTRRVGTALMFLALLITLVLSPVKAGADPSGSPDLTVTADIGTLNLTPTPCSSGRVMVGLTNNGPEPVYGDAFVRAEGLNVSARLISSYLPSGYTWVEQLEITTTAQTEPGDHEVLITAGDSSARIVVTVTPPDFGDNLARTGAPTASSTYPNREPCAALDGNKDSDQWSSGVGWSDSTNKEFPDWWQVTFDQPTVFSRVDLYTIDSAALPAATQGLSDWEVQVLEGATWRTVATVSGNKAGMVSSTFPAVTSTAIRILCLGANGSYSRILEFETYA